MPRKLKTALDETRMLMMGSQILFGFQFEAVFQESVEQLDESRKALAALAILLMAAAVGVLIAPSCRHRLLEQGDASPTMLRMTTRCAASALLLFSVGLGLDLIIVFEPAFASATSIVIGLTVMAASIAAWFGVGLALRTRAAKEQQMKAKSRHEPVGIATKIEQMLTEARVILPGAQALCGFQFIVMLTPAFGELGEALKLVHAASLLCVVLAVILLMAPAAIHRLSFAGADSAKTLRLGSHLVTTALLPLSLGIAGDIYVAVGRSLRNEALGLAAAGLIFSVLLAIWYAWPLLIRARLALPFGTGVQSRR